MKNLILTAATAALLLGLSVTASAKDDEEAEGTLSYCLPNTCLSLEVEALKEEFHAGPYAKFAQKYLGIEARETDETTYVLSKVTLTPLLEADQSSRYYLKVGTKATNAAFLKLTSCGLVSVSDGPFGQETSWRFPVTSQGGNEDTGLISNVSAASTTLYRNVGSGTDYTTLSVQRQAKVAKSLEQKASETASLIFDLRNTRIAIITGDTDATYSGEAMGAAVAEIERLEKEYLSMFVGYTETTVQTAKFDVVPEKGKDRFIAFRFSETAGLLGADELSGTPLVLEITPMSVVGNSGALRVNPAKYAVYRIPAVCTVKLRNGQDVLLSTRLPIHQYGINASFPLTTTTN